MGVLNKFLFFVDSRALRSDRDHVSKKVQRGGGAPYGAAAFFGEESAYWLSGSGGRGGL